MSKVKQMIKRFKLNDNRETRNLEPRHSYCNLIQVKRPRRQVSVSNRLPRCFQKFNC